MILFPLPAETWARIAFFCATFWYETMPYRVGMILSFYIRTPLITRTNVSHRKYVCDIWDILEHRFKPFILVCWKYSSIYGEQNKSVDANAWLWIFVLCMNEWMNEWMNEGHLNSKVVSAPRISDHKNTMYLVEWFTLI